MTREHPASTPAGSGDRTSTRVTLIVPPDPSMARVARLTASALAASAGLTVDAVDDVKIAVSEMLALLVGRGIPELVTMSFDVTPGELAIEVTSQGPPFASDDPELELTKLVLDAVTATHETSHNGGTTRIVASVRSQES